MISRVNTLIPLELMAAGESGRILEIDGHASFVHRLAELGISAGTPIEMIRPGAPCILAVNHQRLSLRLEDAASVLVDLNAD